MPRYHFDLIGHKTVEDKGGQFLANDITACHEADRLAEKLFQVRLELRGKGFSILVSNADGEEVHHAPDCMSSFESSIDQLWTAQALIAAVPSRSTR